MRTTVNNLSMELNEVELYVIQKNSHFTPIITVDDIYH